MQLTHTAFLYNVFGTRSNACRLTVDKVDVATVLEDGIAVSNLRRITDYLQYNFVGFRSDFRRTSRYVLD